jgi:hypothetical protein
MKRGVWLVLLLPGVLALLAVDARSKRAARAAQQPAITVVAMRLPSNGLSLSGGARWLRAPGLEEPGAAFADGIAVPDPDPAGGAMAPPRAAWLEERRR